MYEWRGIGNLFRKPGKSKGKGNTERKFIDLSIHEHSITDGQAKNNEVNLTLKKTKRAAMSENLGMGQPRQARARDRSCSRKTDILRETGWGRGGHSSS